MKGWFRRLNPLRVFSSYFERHPWQRRFVVALPFLIVLALVAPVLNAFGSIVTLLRQVITPLTGTGLGRAILLVVMLGLVALGVYLFARDRVIDVLRRYVLSLHLRAIEALLQGREARAARLFRRVAGIGRLVDLSAGATAGYGLDIDARLKLARLELAADLPRKARAELARIPVRDLDGRLALSHAELNARVFAKHPDHLPESVLQVLDDSHRTWPAHFGIADLLAERLVDTGQGRRAAEVWERCYKASKQNPKVAERLASLYRRLAREQLQGGDFDDSMRLLKSSLRYGDSEEALLLKADLHLARRELGVALQVLEAIPTPAAKARLAELLRHDSVPVDPRRLLLHIPRRDTLLALAEHWLETGDLRKAGRALRICLRETGSSPRLLTLLASLAMREDRPEQAETSLRLALEANVG